MPKTAFEKRASGDYGVAISDLYRRQAKLEQLLLSPAITGGGNITSLTLEDITLDDGVEPPVLINTVIGDPTGLTLSTDTFFNEIYIDADWTPPAGANVAGSEVQIRKRLSTGPDVYDAPSLLYVPGSNHRFRGLEPDTHYEIRVWAINTAGVRSAAPEIEEIDTVGDATVPPAVSGLVLARGATSAVIYWTDLTELQAPDVTKGRGSYLVELATDAGFVSVIRTGRTSGNILQFTDITAAETAPMWARVAAVDTSGNQGAWAETGGSLTVGGVVEGMIFGTITGVKITVGTLEGDRIVGDSVEADKLTASTFTSGRITLSGGGEFWVEGGGGDGVLINSVGIRLYKAGTPVVTLDALTGNATFEGDITGSDITGSTVTGGTVQTANSGRRIVLDGAADTMYFYSGDGSETFAGVMETDVGSTYGPLLRLQAPYTDGADYARIDIYGEDSGSSAGISNTDIHAQQLQMYWAADLWFTIRGGGIAPIMMLGGEDVVYTFRARGGEINVVEDIPGGGGWSLFASGDEGYVHTPWGFIAHDAGNNNVDLDTNYDHAAYQGFTTSDRVVMLGAHINSSGQNACWTFEVGGGANWAARTGSGEFYIDIVCQDLIEISSLRFKENLEPLVPDDKLDLLVAQSFDKKFDSEMVDGAEIYSMRKSFGLVAEEVFEVYPELVTLDEQDAPLGVKYSQLVPLLLVHVQSLRKRMAVLEANVKIKDKEK
jgi:hypothetical protein